MLVGVLAKYSSQGAAKWLGWRIRMRRGAHRRRTKFEISQVLASGRDVAKRYLYYRKPRLRDIKSKALEG